MKYIKWFNETGIADIPLVGGKNASLGEMFSQLHSAGIRVPDGIATTALAYWNFLTENKITDSLKNSLDTLNHHNFNNLSQVGEKCRQLILNAPLHDDLKNEIVQAYHILRKKTGNDFSLAVRSSATAEDLPNASFAGQQETFLNIKGEQQLIAAVHHCFASLFTDRAIKYRVDNGFEHMKVALSAGVQIMVRADKGCSGVIFTIDPDSGFKNAILISAAWGLGENVVQGNINTDEFIVYKPFLHQVKNPVISRRLGSKEKTMIYNDAQKQVFSPEQSNSNIETPAEKRNQFVLSQEEIIRLAGWAAVIEDHYKQPMDIEWAKDGDTNELYILQARPETVHGKKGSPSLFKEYTLKGNGRIICKGIGLGNKIKSGKARILSSPREIDLLQEGEILVTTNTDPDWDPVLKKAAAIVTDQGSRTSHAAIVARELGTAAIVGTLNATSTIHDGHFITVSTAEGETGIVYEGILPWEEHEIDMSKISIPQTKPMLILAHPDQAFKYSFLPHQGVGLMRMEFIINNAIGIHPMALCHFNTLDSLDVQNRISKITSAYRDKRDFFIHKLAESTAMIAAAFYPHDVIVRMSDFKSNEYANLLGGKQFEPSEENPMIGFRGASRYYHPLYKEGFELECKAMRMVREEMGFKNIKLMIPFCRTVDEAVKVNALMAQQGLKRGENGLELYMMVEIPSNALLAEEFAKHYDGFSIGSNDLTQLTLGADRDSPLLSEIFSPFDPAVMQLIKMTIEKAKKAGIKTGLCGQAPSDYPEYAQFLVGCGINSISFNHDALFSGIENIYEAETKIKTNQ